MATTNEVRAGQTIYEAYYGSSRYIGLTTVDLPEFTAASLDLEGPGIAGTMSMTFPGMFDNIECTLHWRTIQGNLTWLMSHQAHTLTLRSSQNIYDAGSGKFRAQAVKILIRGVPQKMTLGKLEKASETESESTLNLDYIKIWVDGKEVLEYDKFNYIFKVNGVDNLNGTRSAIGREVSSGTK